MFYAAMSSLAMFKAVKNLVKDTIGHVGLAEQLRHQSAKGQNVLMTACQDPGVFRAVWTLLERTKTLEELLDEEDKDGKSWILYAAEDGNCEVFPKLDKVHADNYAIFSSKDNNGWNGFTYAARGQTVDSLNFLNNMCRVCFIGVAGQERLEEQLKRKSIDDSTMQMHAAIGGYTQFALVSKMMRDIGYAIQSGEDSNDPMLLSWAAKGGDIIVLEMVAKGIKVREFSRF